MRHSLLVSVIACPVLGLIALAACSDGTQPTSSEARIGSHNLPPATGNFAELAVSNAARSTPFRQAGSVMLSANEGRAVRIDGSDVVLEKRGQRLPALRTSQVRLGDKAVVPAARFVSDQSGDARRDIASGLAEVITPTSEGYRWSWEFERNPGGSVEVALGLDADAARDVNERGLVLKAGKKHVRVGHATWIDADGTRTPVKGFYKDGRFIYRVPADLVASSTYPAVLDPAIGAEFNGASNQLVTGADDYVRDTRLFPRPNGDVVVVESSDNDPNMRVVTPATDTLKMAYNKLKLSTNSVSYDAALEGDNLAYAWVDGGILYGRRFDLATVTWKDNAPVPLTNVLDNAPSGMPRIASLGTAGWFVAWTDMMTGSQIFAAKYNPDLTAAGTPYAVTQTGTYELPQANYAFLEPLPLNGTTIALTVEGMNPTTGRPTYFLNVSGATPTQAGVYTPAGSLSVSWAKDAAGFAGVWRDYQSSSYHVILQRVSISGAPAGGAVDLGVNSGGYEPLVAEMPGTGLEVIADKQLWTVTSTAVSSPAAVPCKSGTTNCDAMGVVSYQGNKVLVLNTEDGDGMGNLLTVTDAGSGNYTTSSSWFVVANQFIPQKKVQVAHDRSTNSYYVAWEQYNPATGLATWKLTGFDAFSTTRKFAPVDTAVDTANDKTLSVNLVAEGGRVALIWKFERQSNGTEYAVMQRFSGTDGSPIDASRQLFEATLTNPPDPIIAQDGNTLLVTFQPQYFSGTTQTYAVDLAAAAFSAVKTTNPVATPVGRSVGGKLLAFGKGQGEFSKVYLTTTSTLMTPVEIPEVLLMGESANVTSGKTLFYCDRCTINMKGNAFIAPDGTTVPVPDTLTNGYSSFKMLAARGQLARPAFDVWNSTYKITRVFEDTTALPDLTGSFVSVAQSTPYDFTTDGNDAVILGYTGEQAGPGESHVFLRWIDLGLPNGSTCTSNDQCATSYCSGTGKCALQGAGGSGGSSGEGGAAGQGGSGQGGTSQGGSSGEGGTSQGGSSQGGSAGDAGAGQGGSGEGGTSQGGSSGEGGTSQGGSSQGGSAGSAGTGQGGASQGGSAGAAQGGAAGTANGGAPGAGGSATGGSSAAGSAGVAGTAGSGDPAESAPEEDSGCGCRTASESNHADGRILLGLGIAALTIARRRRR